MRIYKITYEADLYEDGKFDGTIKEEVDVFSRDGLQTAEKKALNYAQKHLSSGSYEDECNEKHKYTHRNHVIISAEVVAEADI